MNLNWNFGDSTGDQCGLESPQIVIGWEFVGEEPNQLGKNLDLVRIEFAMQPERVITGRGVTKTVSHLLVKIVFFRNGIEGGKNCWFSLIVSIFGTWLGEFVIKDGAKATGVGMNIWGSRDVRHALSAIIGNALFSAVSGKDIVGLEALNFVNRFGVQVGMIDNSFNNSILMLSFGEHFERSELSLSLFGTKIGAAKGTRF